MNLGFQIKDCICEQWRESHMLRLFPTVQNIMKKFRNVHRTETLKGVNRKIQCVTSCERKSQKYYEDQAIFNDSIQAVTSTNKSTTVRLKPVSDGQKVNVQFNRPHIVLTDNRTNYGIIIQRAYFPKLFLFCFAEK